ncbi:MAG TPA: Gfo/Idh/MocA family oxidoreductase [Rectinema sp.]|nr:Gfo/Idh/MocA family oxidoreductase [Rectinema sp.]HOU61838.1 Gfo/Idh/MocA family oxidoreductase [Rectinema sp.]HOW11373.1 Gfo/Idh/MocA family oxidoreductase [Rectinema sp.]
MKKLRVAIIGIGKIGISHLKAIKAIEPLGYAELAAICSLNPNKIKSLCDDYDIPVWYTSYQEMLKSESLDLVHNCTPNVLHYDVNRGILEAGLYDLSEKPLTIDSQQSGALVALAKNRHLKTAVNFVYRYYPIIMHIKELISKGELGTIYSIHGTYLQDWLLFDHDYDWRVESRYGGPSRALADIGSHWIDIAEFLLDRRVESIAADLATFIPKRIRSPSETIIVDTEDFASVLMRFEGGIHGCLTVSQVSAGRSNGISFEIDGSIASLRWSQEHPERASLKYREEEELFIDEKGTISLANELEENKEANAGASKQERFLEAQQRMIDNFYRSIVFDDVPIYADFEQGHRIVKIIEAAIESNQKERWIHSRHEGS